MNLFILIALIALIGWQVLVIRRDINSQSITTTLFLSLESKDECENGLPLKSFHLLKKTNISFAIVPGMELSDLGLSPTTQVMRVVFEDFQDNVRGVHLKPRRLPLSDLDNVANSYLKHGWQSN